jgi:hypothetical protein
MSNLSLKIRPELHQAFKITAVVRKIPMKHLFEASYLAYLELHGDEAVEALLPKDLRPGKRSCGRIRSWGFLDC